MKKEIEEILKEAIGAQEAIDVFVPEKENFGHYSTNIAMRLAGKTGKNPLEFAKELAAKVKTAAPAGFFVKIDVQPPGFINFWLSTKVLQDEFGNVATEKNFGKSSIGAGKTVIVEYSQPNIGKMMHVGHLRTTIIGDALANIYEYLGYKVFRWNYIGDWGTQFGKLIAAYKRWGNKEKVEASPIDELQALYVRFHDEAKNPPAGGPDLEKCGQEEFRKLEGGDRENRKLWEWFKNESLKELDKIYKTLGVRFDIFIGESFFEKEMRPLVKDLLDRKLAQKSQGALVINLDRFNLPPALIQKADGASLYLSRDIANLKYRLEKYKPAKILYVVGNEQSLHFEQLFAVAKILKMDFAELVHVKYGLVLGESGEKLATREGRTILLKDVLEKAIRLARDIVDQKARDVSPAEKDKIATAVGIGALKYNDLKENRTSDIVFDWEKMLSFKGDSAPYLQYTYARLRSILRKKEKGGKKEDFKMLDQSAELEVIRKIIEFPEEIERSGENLSTSNLAGYLYNLAVLVNRLYETTPVLKEENESRRAALLVLIEKAALVLRSGLGFLGIKTLEKI